MPNWEISVSVCGVGIRSARGTFGSSTKTHHHIMAAASASTVWNVEQGAGAQEPGAAAVTEVEDDETLLRVAFYNVGIQQSDLDSKRWQKAQTRCEFLAHDIAEGFRRHRLELLCLCELGEHEIGLQGRKNLGCDSQEKLLQLIVQIVDRDLHSGAPEPAVEVVLL